MKEGESSEWYEMLFPLTRLISPDLITSSLISVPPLFTFFLLILYKTFNILNVHFGLVADVLKTRFPDILTWARFAFASFEVEMPPNQTWQMIFFFFLVH